jgi:hypothetical protein
VKSKNQRILEIGQTRPVAVNQSGDSVTTASSLSISPIWIFEQKSLKDTAKKSDLVFEATH